MKLVHLILVSLVAVAISFTSCGKGGCENSLQGLSDEVSDFSAASSTYSADPSKANCLAYVKAYDEYIDAYEKYLKKCSSAGFTQANLTALRESRDDFKNSNPCD